MLTVAERTGFAAWLEGELRSRGLTQTKFAAYIGRPSQTVNAWINDGRQPRTEHVPDIARVLHLPLDEVLRLAGHLPPLEYELPDPEIIPELSMMLREMTPYEQRRFALPAIRVAEELLRDSKEPEA